MSSKWSKTNSIKCYSTPIYWFHNTRVSLSLVHWSRNTRNGHFVLNIYLISVPFKYKQCVTLHWFQLYNRNHFTLFILLFLNAPSSVGLFRFHLEFRQSRSSTEIQDCIITLHYQSASKRLSKSKTINRFPKNKTFFILLLNILCTVLQIKLVNILKY